MAILSIPSQILPILPGRIASFRSQHIQTRDALSNSRSSPRPRDRDPTTHFRPIRHSARIRTRPSSPTTGCGGTYSTSSGGGTASRIARTSSSWVGVGCGHGLSSRLGRPSLPAMRRKGRRGSVPSSVPHGLPPGPVRNRVRRRRPPRGPFDPPFRDV